MDPLKQAYLAYCIDEAAALVGSLLDQEEDEDEADDRPQRSAGMQPTRRPARPTLEFGERGREVDMFSHKATVPYIGPKTPKEMAAWRKAGRIPTTYRLATDRPARKPPAT